MRSTGRLFYPLTLTIITSLITGCEFLNKTENFLSPINLPINIEKKIMEQQTIYIYCGKGNVQEYLDQGWEVVETKEEEVPCSWKTEKATPNCNLNKKGCKISVPDKMGKQVEYLLEKEVIIPTKDTVKKDNIN